MYIESTYFDNGKAFIKKTDHLYPDKTTDDYDYYCEEVDDLQEWIGDNLEIDYDDIVPLVLDLDAGESVEITNYI